jgi:hypothetical protein
MVSTTVTSTQEKTIVRSIAWTQFNFWIAAILKVIVSAHGFSLIPTVVALFVNMTRKIKKEWLLLLIIHATPFAKRPAKEILEISFSILAQRRAPALIPVI